MDLIIIFLAGWSVFATANSDFLNKVEGKEKEGYEWVYTGKQPWVDKGDNYAIPIYSYKGTKPYTIYSLIKK